MSVRTGRGLDQFMSGHVAPTGNILTRTRVGRMKIEKLSGRDVFHGFHQGHHQIAAAEVLGVNGVNVHDWSAGAEDVRPVFRSAHPVA